ncbi:MAG: hypothetical protein SGI74_00420 [Oligoflexia bacterium]|nr:hypothetical protein [Oligoflexia bacterium]
MKPTQSSPEREFLHAVASPLAAALFLIDIILENASNQNDAATSVQIQRLKKSLNTITLLLQERRNCLIEQGNAKAANE